MPRSRYTQAHLLAYHGCDASIGEGVLAGKKALKPSNEDYDWLGGGIYFWVDSPERAWDWANSHPKSKVKNPFVLGALIYPGLCLNLTDYGVIRQLEAAHKVLAAARGPDEMPENTFKKDGVTMLRRLDCAVIETLHALREDQGEVEYDSVYGVFEEGREAYKGAGFKTKTHIQIAVRKPEIIVGYFRVDMSAFAKTAQPKRR